MALVRGTGASPPPAGSGVHVTVVLPCRNEATTVAACVAAATWWFARRSLQGEVVVVDNASTDGSARVAARAGARVVLEHRRGYGAALRAGMRSARGDVVVLADADGTYDLADLDAFYEPLTCGRPADVVMGDRLSVVPPRDAMSLSHLWGNRVLSALTRTLTGTSVTDVHCGLRSYRRAALTADRTWGTGMEFATHMVTHAHAAGLEVVETPVVLRPAAAARRSHLRPVRDGLRHLAAIGGAAARRARSPRGRAGTGAVR